MRLWSEISQLPLIAGHSAKWCPQLRIHPSGVRAHCALGTSIRPPLSEILAVKGAELGGMFPKDVQTFITMAGAVNPKAKQGAAARDLLKCLMSPAGLATIKAKGMERT